MRETRITMTPLWPTRAQELLLRSAVVPGPAAIEAWDTWKQDHDLIETELDHGSFRLLALVYKNLLAQGAAEPRMPRLKGIYRYWWCSNQHLFYRAAGVIRGLEREGIPTLVLKGAAASVAYYQDTGVRPMGDIDLLVPLGQAPAALAHLGRQGWRPTRPRVEDLIRYQHSVQMVHETGEMLDLHWHVLAECVQPSADEGFWQRAVPIRIQDVSSRALGPTDALLHAIVHGMRWNAEPTIRWVADSMAILHAPDVRVDWTALEQEARRQRLLLRLRLGLGYLKHRMGAPIPEAAFQRLRAIRPAVLEHLESRVLALDADRTQTMRPEHALLFAVQYLRFMSGKSLVRSLAETPEYVRYRLRGRQRPAPESMRRIKRGIQRLFVPSAATADTPHATPARATVVREAAQ
jgi:hypothetical protein